MSSALPFSDELWNFVKTERAFAGSLKLADPARFEVLHTVIVSQLPEAHPLGANQVLGITYLDKVKLEKRERPLFKQDFVVRQASDGTFVSYTAKWVVAAAGSPYVRSIDDFAREYGDGGRYYTRAGHPKPLVHHLDDVDDLPPELQEEAEQLKKRFGPP
jgi:hypothetical protein